MVGRPIYDRMPGPPACGEYRGTRRGATAHYRAGQESCPECRAASAAHIRNYRRRNGISTRKLVPLVLLTELLRAAPAELRDRAMTEIGVDWPVDPPEAGADG